MNAYSPATFPPTSVMLEHQIRRAVHAMSTWNGELDLPGTNLAQLQRDRENRAIAAHYPELAAELVDRIRVGWIDDPDVRDAVQELRWCASRRLLGLDRRWPPMSFAGVLLRALTARFVLEVTNG